MEIHLFKEREVKRMFISDKALVSKMMRNSGIISKKKKKPRKQIC